MTFTISSSDADVVAVFDDLLVDFGSAGALARRPPSIRFDGGGDVDRGHRPHLVPGDGRRRGRVLLAARGVAGLAPPDGRQRPRRCRLPRRARPCRCTPGPSPAPAARSCCRARRTRARPRSPPRSQRPAIDSSPTRSVVSTRTDSPSPPTASRWHCGRRRSNCWRRPSPGSVGREVASRSTNASSRPPNSARRRRAVSPGRPPACGSPLEPVEVSAIVFPRYDEPGRIASPRSGRPRRSSG